MSRRAKRGWGAVRTLPSGRYQARYRDPETYERVTAPETFATRADADAWLALKRADLERGEALDDRAGRRPLDEWADAFVETRRHALRPSTVTDYEGLLRRYVRPRFGTTPVGRIRSSDVDRWVASLSADLAPATVRRAHRVLSLVLDMAVRDRAIAANPCATRSAPLPRSAPTSRPVLSPADLEAFASHMRRPEHRALVRLLAYGGLRIGEALGLRRSDLDVRAGTLTVRRTAAEVSGRVHVGPTKTYETRTIPLPAPVLAELRDLVASRPIPLRTDPYLISGTTEPTRYRNLMRDAWYPARSRWSAARATADLEPIPVRPHDLRATCASLLIDAGASPKDVQAHLGHADVTTTLRLYARVRPGRADDLAARLSVLISETG